MLLSGTGLSYRADGEEFSNLIGTIASDFEMAVDGWKRDYQSLLSEWKRQRSEAVPDTRVLNYLAHQADSLWSTAVIEEMANRRFLPRYGFPIGVLALSGPGITNWKSREESVRLQRSGIIALSEYVPGSVVLAGGRYFESHGLSRSFAKGETPFGPIALRRTCTDGHTSYSFDLKLDPVCPEPNCNCPSAGSPTSLLLLRHGFSTAVWDPPSWSGKTDRVGTTSLCTTSFVQKHSRVISDFADIKGLNAVICEDGELIVANSGEHAFGFAVCTQCGFAESERKLKGTGKLDLPLGFDRHIRLLSEKDRCWARKDDAPVLRHQHLAARHETDMLQITFLGASAEVITTLGHTLRLAGAELLELDHREIGFFAEGLHVRLFENTPGGCGHLAELEKQGRDWLRTAVQKLTGSKEHDAQCETACLNCILSSASQFDVESGKIQRVETLRYLSQLLDAGAVPAKSQNTGRPDSNNTPSTPIGDVVPAFQAKAAKRVNKKNRST